MSSQYSQYQPTRHLMILPDPASPMTDSPGAAGGPAAELSRSQADFEADDNGTHSPGSSLGMHHRKGCAKRYLIGCQSTAASAGERAGSGAAHRPAGTMQS